MTRRITWLVSLFVCLLGAVTAQAQTNHTVRVVNNRFVPDDLAIQAGDSVTWTNEGMNHNVVADDGSFRCANGCDGEGGDGDTASNAWSFTRTFATPGTVPYFCEAHGSAGGLGMAGTVVVESGTGGDDPGSLRFADANLNVQEFGGARQIVVQRVDGDDGAVSVSFQTENGSAVAGQDYQQTSGAINWADNDDDPKSFQVPIVDDGDEEGDETFRVVLFNPGGGATLAQPDVVTVTIRDDDQGGGGDPNPPGSGSGTLELASDVFEVNENGTAAIQVVRTGGSDGSVSATVTVVGNTATGGEDFQEVTQTVTFGSGDTTPQQVIVPLIDDNVDEGVEIADVTLGNPSAGATLGDVVRADLAIFDDDGGAGCTPGPETLCLGEDDRFKVQVSWRDQQGGTGRGQAFALPLQDSGLFTFFDPDNVEILVKVLNTCAFSNRIWVFFAGTTNQGFTLTVTDTERDAVQYYTNPVGRTAETVLDVQAFQTCP